VTKSRSYVNAITPTIRNALTSGSRAKKDVQFVTTVSFEFIYSGKAMRILKGWKK
jgi:hypothetical protein